MPACTYSEFCHIFHVYSTEASLFEVEQLSNSNVALKAPNGKYVTIKMTGALNCSSDACGDKEKFRVCDFDDWVFLTTLHLVLFLCQNLLVSIWSCFFLAGHVGVRISIPHSFLRRTYLPNNVIFFYATHTVQTTTREHIQTIPPSEIRKISTHGWDSVIMKNIW